MTKECIAAFAGLICWLVCSVALFVLTYGVYFWALSAQFPFSIYVGQTVELGIMMSWPLTLGISLLVSGFLGVSAWTGVRKRLSLPPLEDKEPAKEKS